MYKNNFYNQFGVIGLDVRLITNLLNYILGVLLINDNPITLSKKTGNIYKQIPKEKHKSNF